MVASRKGFVGKGKESDRGGKTFFHVYVVDIGNSAFSGLL